MKINFLKYLDLLPIQPNKIFSISIGSPTKRQMDIWQGALRKAGIPPSRAKQLRRNSEKYLKTLDC